MPAIDNRAASLDPSLQDVLGHKSQWKNYFSRDSNFIISIFQELAAQISKKDFFVEDYITTCLAFIKGYVESEFIEEKKRTRGIDSAILQAFNSVSVAFHHRVEQLKLELSQKKIVRSYLQFLSFLMGPKYRHLFTRPEIEFNAKHLQDISSMLQTSNATDESLVREYESLLKASFDVPEFLIDYKPIAQSVSELAKVCFLNINLNVDWVAARFFGLLGYQGQLLDYYKNDRAFHLNAELVSTAIDHVEQVAIKLQQSFSEKKNITDEVLKHYFYLYFLKILCADNPGKLEAYKSNPYYKLYSEFDYVALPYRYECENFPSTYKVHIAYSNELPQGIPEKACQAMACTKESDDAWKATLKLYEADKATLDAYANLGITSNNRNKPKSILAASEYVFLTGNSYEHYQKYPFSYGVSPAGGGMYISDKLSNNIVYGTGYGYWGNDDHNYIGLSRHELQHHNNYITYNEALRINSKISNFLARPINEGRSVLISEGACARGYADKNYTGVPAPDVSMLLDGEFIDYGSAWLQINYLQQEYPSFYSDILILNKPLFRSRWDRILPKDQLNFIDWKEKLKEICGPYRNEDLTINTCPSIYLKDYRLKHVITPQKITPPRLARSTRPEPGILTKKTSGTTPSLPEPRVLPKKTGYTLWFEFKDSMGTMDFNDFKATAESLELEILNHRDPTNGQTLLHHLYLNDLCDTQRLEVFLKKGAIPSQDHKGRLPKDIAKERCDNARFKEIKALLDDQYAPTTPTLTTLSSGSGTSLKPKIPITKEMADQLGHKLILAIYAKNFNDIQELLEKDANLNYSHSTNGQTPLHSLYVYGLCDPQLLEVFLKKGAIPVLDHKGRLPYHIAEGYCDNATLHKIKVLFDQYPLTTPTLTTLNNELTLTTLNNEIKSTDRSRGAEIYFILLLPFISGVVSASSCALEKRFIKEDSCLAGPINVIKPIVLATISAGSNSFLMGSASSIGLENAWGSFFAYLGVNSVSLFIAGPGCQYIYDKVPDDYKNKLTNFIFQIMFYTLFFNPGLFASEGAIEKLLETLWMSCMNGVLFKAGEWCTSKAISCCFPANAQANNVSAEPSVETTFLENHLELYMKMRGANFSPMNTSSEEETVLISHNAQANNASAERDFETEPLTTEKAITEEQYSYYSDNSFLNDSFSSLSSDRNANFPEKSSELTGFENCVDGFESCLNRFEYCVKQLKDNAQEKIGHYQGHKWIFKERLDEIESLLKVENKQIKVADPQVFDFDKLNKKLEDIKVDINKKKKEYLKEEDQEDWPDTLENINTDIARAVTALQALHTSCEVNNSNYAQNWATSSQTPSPGTSVFFGEPPIKTKAKGFSSLLRKSSKKSEDIQNDIELLAKGTQNGEKLPEFGFLF